MDRDAVEEDVAPLELHLAEPEAERERLVEQRAVRVAQRERTRIQVLRRVRVPERRVLPRRREAKRAVRPGRERFAFEALLRAAPRHESGEDVASARRVLRQAREVGDERDLAALDRGLDRRVRDAGAGRHRLQAHRARESAVAEVDLAQFGAVGRVEDERPLLRRVGLRLDRERLLRAGLRESGEIHLAAREDARAGGLAVEEDVRARVHHLERHRHAPSRGPGRNLDRHLVALLDNVLLEPSSHGERDARPRRGRERLRGGRRPREQRRGANDGGTEKPRSHGTGQGTFFHGVHPIMPWPPASSRGNPVADRTAIW